MEPNPGGAPDDGGSAADLPVIDDFDELVRLVERHPGLYLRHSAGPQKDAEAGPSRDYEADVELPGLSVTTIGPEPWWPRPVADWVARRICQYAELGEAPERFPWLLDATIVGRGPDHEPLVADIRPVARIGQNALATAREVFDRNFEPGRDSRDSLSGSHRST